MRKSILVFIATIPQFFISTSYGQSMIEADMAAYANMRLDSSGGVTSCGFEINAVHINVTAGTLTAIGTSLMIQGDGYALGKLTGKKGPISGGLDGLSPAQVHSGWFRTPGQKAAASIDKFFDGENEGSKLFVAAFSPAIETLAAIAMSEELHIAISWDPGYNSIYFGKPVVDEAQRAQFFSCIDDLQNTIRATIQ